MIIEKANIEDAETILKLQKIAFENQAMIYNDFCMPPLTQTLEDISSEFDQRIFLKAVQDEGIVGSVRGNVKDGRACIGRLVVHPEYQNQGIGKELMRKIEACFPEAERFELFTGHKSEKNIGLYQRLGYKIFKEEELREDYKIVYLEKYRE